MKIQAATWLILLVVGAAGCSHDESGTASRAPTGTEATPKALPPTSGGDAPVAAADWRAVIDDWYDNGVFDDPHACSAVRAAMERLPDSSPTSHTAFADLRRYADKGCGR